MATTILNGNVTLIDKNQEFKEQLINTLALAITTLRRGFTSTSITTPPTNPASESLYLVPTGATGAWSGQAGKIAQYYLGTLSFYTPFEGLVIWANDIQKWAVYSGGAWNFISTTGLTNPMTTASDIIIGGTGGTATRLAVGSNNTLLGVSGGSLDYNFTVGTSNNNLVQLTSTGKLPAVDGSQLTNLPSSNWTLGTTKTSTFTPSSGVIYPVNTSSASIAITLPTTAAGRYRFYDAGANSATSGFYANNFTINPPTGYTIANLGSGNSLAINLAYGWVELWLNGTNFDLVGAAR